MIAESFTIGWRLWIAWSSEIIVKFNSKKLLTFDETRRQVTSVLRRR